MSGELENTFSEMFAFRYLSGGRGPPGPAGLAAVGTAGVTGVGASSLTWLSWGSSRCHSAAALSVSSWPGLFHEASSLGRPGGPAVTDTDQTRHALAEGAPQGCAPPGVPLAPPLLVGALPGSRAVGVHRSPSLWAKAAGSPPFPGLEGPMG